MPWQQSELNRARGVQLAVQPSFIFTLVLQLSREPATFSCVIQSRCGEESRIGEAQKFIPQNQLKACSGSKTQSGRESNCQDVRTAEIAVELAANVVPIVRRIEPRGLNLWRSGVYPAQALIGIAVSIVVESSEASGNKRHPMTLTIADEGNIPIVPQFNVQFQIGMPQEAPKGAPQRAAFAMNAVIPLPRPGRYAVSANVGTSLKKTVTFDAIFVGQQVAFTPPSTEGTERGN